MASRTKDLKTEVNATGKEKYFYQIFELLKKKDNFLITSKDAHFNHTEIRLLAEILAASYVGKRLISTQLAKLLGVTRSAISQVVNNLEKDGIVRRVPDDVDKKIAYIEVTENALSTYKKDLETCVEFVGSAVDAFGEEKFETMCALFRQFSDIVEEKAKNI